MRMWSVHPKYLDTKGLVACWRESLGAQKNILGYFNFIPKPKGYNNHPQLIRFKTNSMIEICSYLYFIYQEGIKRGYKFDYNKIYLKNINEIAVHNTIPVSLGQVKYEMTFLQYKLKDRDMFSFTRNLEYIINDGINVQLNPLFQYYDSDKTEPWEKIKDIS